MTRLPRSIRIAVAGTIAGFVLMASAGVRAAGDSAAPAVASTVRRLQRTPTDDVRRRLFEALLTRPDVDPSLQAAVAALWNGAVPPDADLLDRIAHTAALVDDRAAALVRGVGEAVDPWMIPEPRWLSEPAESPWLRDQLRLYFGRALGRRKMYDRSLQALAGLEPADVVDPASLLFYQAAAYHHQLQKASGLRALDRLLDDVADCPQRYRAVATIMREDLKKLEDESLDHIARRMDDIRRRLDLGDAERRTQRIEEGVVRSLDKMIEELEKQQQQQQSSGGGGASGSPMQDSRIAKRKGPGETDRKDIGRKSDWGDLPPETREQIKQQIGRDLPAHYYDLIQQYFDHQQAGPSKP